MRRARQTAAGDGSTLGERRRCGVRPCGHNTYKLITIAYVSHNEISITVGVGCSPSMPVMSDARTVPGAINHVRFSAFACPTVSKIGRAHV